MRIPAPMMSDFSMVVAVVGNLIIKLSLLVNISFNRSPSLLISPTYKYMEVNVD